jgi:hypothetical protein
MSTSNRLSTVAPDLVVLGESLSAEQRKVAACRVAEWACHATGAMAFLDEGRIRTLLDVNHSATQEEKKEVFNNIEDLDEKYFSVVDLHDGLDDAGLAMQWFGKARATASIFYALNSSDVQDFCEALYEAQAATGDLSGVRKLCRSVD